MSDSQDDEGGLQQNQNLKEVLGQDVVLKQKAQATHAEQGRWRMADANTMAG